MKTSVADSMSVTSVLFERGVGGCEWVRGLRCDCGIMIL